MDFGEIIKLVSGGKPNPVMEQLMAVNAMLVKLSKEEQVRVITNFVNELNEAVKNAEKGE